MTTPDDIGKNLAARAIAYGTGTAAVGAEALQGAEEGQRRGEARLARLQRTEQQIRAIVRDEIARGAK